MHDLLVAHDRAPDAQEINDRAELVYNSQHRHSSLMETTAGKLNVSGAHADLKSVVDIVGVQGRFSVPTVSRIMHGRFLNRSELLVR